MCFDAECQKRNVPVLVLAMKHSLEQVLALVSVRVIHLLVHVLETSEIHLISSKTPCLSLFHAVMGHSNTI